jgi:tRNA nucleotidyltransferase (CCA-adding enzyme)
VKEYLKRLPDQIQDLVYLASKIAKNNNMSVYLVGGFVRDLLLGVKNLDLDIVVEGEGIKFAEDFAAELKKAKLIRHRRFGTATVILSDNLKVDPSTLLRVNGERSRTIDIATARKETYPKPASLPEVRQGVLKEDLARRDFTINAMAVSISGSNYDMLIDFFGGMNDLRARKIRVLHNLSFIDDPTRILRAIRFEKRYNFKIEPQTLKFLKEAFKIGSLERVGPHRLRDEIILLLKEKQPIRYIRRIQRLIGFNFINPNLSVSKNTYRVLGAVRDEILWFRRKYPRFREIDTWLIYFMGLIDSLNINDIKSVCLRFSFRRGEEIRMLNYKRRCSSVIAALSQKEIKPAKIFALLEPLSYEVIILIKAKSRNKNVKKHIEDFLKIYHRTRISISGDDLKRLGVSPGPDYRKIFNKILKAKLKGSVKTPEEELSLAKKLVKAK